MARLPFPQDRTVYSPGGGIWRTATAGLPVEIRLDGNPGEEPPQPGETADVLRHDSTEGPIVVDSTSQMAPWLGPDQEEPDKTLVVRVNNGPWWRVEARIRDRIDALDARIADVEENGGGSSVPTSRTITAGTGLTGGGDLTANRTLTVTYGTTSGTAAQGNDSRIVGAEQAANKGQVSGYAELDSSGLVPAAQLPVGTSAGTVAAGNDSRIADVTGAISAVDDRVDQCIAVVYYTGSAWPTRPAGYVSVEWRGPDANRPTIGGDYALDGFDTFFPIA